VSGALNKEEWRAVCAALGKKYKEALAEMSDTGRLPATFVNHLTNEFKALEHGWENDVELEEWIPLFRGHSPTNWKKGMAWRYADTPAYPSRLFTNFEPSWHQDRVYYVDSKAIK
jgi:hypothetical protein